MFNLSQEQIDFLKNNKFYFREICQPYINYPYVYGNIGRNQPEFYNIESVEELIKEIKEYGTPLEDKNSIQFKTVTDTTYEIDSSILHRISKGKNRKTGEIEVESIIKPSFGQPYLKKIVSITEDYYNVCDRYNGEFGNGDQYIRRHYRSKNAAIKVAIPLLERKIEEFKTQINYVNELIEQYKKEII